MKKLLNAVIKHWSFILLHINPFALNNKAVALNGLKKYEDALKCSNKALELNPQNDWTWFIKGIAFNGLKKYDEALKCSDKALAA